MRIYIFKSETRKELRAFAGDPGGSKRTWWLRHAWRSSPRTSGTVACRL